MQIKIENVAMISFQKDIENFDLKAEIVRQANILKLQKTEIERLTTVNEELGKGKAPAKKAVEKTVKK